jgi:hypothetical protein
MRRTLSSILVAAVLLATAAWAHEGTPHTRGTVTAVDATHIEVQTVEGEKVSAPLDKSAKVTKGKGAATLADVQPGSRVVLHYRKDGKRLVVTEVQLGEGKPDDTHAHTHTNTHTNVHHD